MVDRDAATEFEEVRRVGRERGGCKEREQDAGAQGASRGTEAREADTEDQTVQGMKIGFVLGAFGRASGRTGFPFSRASRRLVSLPGPVEKD